MRNLYDREVDRFRVTHPALGRGDETCGAFVIPSPIDGKPMIVIASQGGEWDHVSVSRNKRPPSWAEMEQVRLLFFRPDEAVMQLHVPAADHVNLHPNCLHLWRPQTVDIPRPPAWMVGPKDGQTVEDSLVEGTIALGAEDHRAGLQLALEAFQRALVEHCVDSLEAEKFAIRAHAAAIIQVKPSPGEGRHPFRFGGD